QTLRVKNSHYSPSSIADSGAPAKCPAGSRAPPRSSWLGTTTAGQRSSNVPCRAAAAREFSSGQSRVKKDHVSLARRVDLGRGGRLAALEHAWFGPRFGPDSRRVERSAYPDTSAAANARRQPHRPNRRRRRGGAVERRARDAVTGARR